MKKNVLFGKGVSWLAVFTLAFTSAPGVTALAEDTGYAEEPADAAAYAETDPADAGYEETELAEETAAVFIVTGFPEFETDTEGNYLNAAIQEKYGALTALAGTSEEELGLPKDLQVEGYWEVNGAEAGTETWTLTDMQWRSGSDTDPAGEPAYSESMPAGTYVFYPDFAQYLAEQALLGDTTFDEIRMEEGVSLLKLSVTIEELTETETEAQTETQTETLPITETETAAADPAYSETEYAETVEEETEIVWTETSGTEAGEVILEQADTEQSEYDYINNTNDALIGASGSDVSVNGETMAQSEPETVAESEAEVILFAASETSGPETEEVTESKTSESETETVTESETSEPETETVTESETSEPETGTAQDLTVTFVFSDGTASYTYENTDTDHTITLKQTPAEGENSVSITLPCASALDLSSLGVTFYDAAMTAVISSAPTDGQNFTDGTAKDFILTDSSGVNYTIKLTIQKTQHTWQKATCTQSKTCTVCGATEGEALGHDWKDATCTQPKTCKRCSITEGEALGHSWKAATCTQPKTCTRCNATEGKALGHDLRDDWQTVTASTETTHGTAVRYCNRSGCDYSETKTLNIIGDPSWNTISGIEEGQNYSLNTVLTFTASGAAMGNTAPINGDVRYVPSSWMIQNTPGNFKDNFTGSFSISQSGRYVLAVTFQKQTYQDGWQVTDIADERTVTFTVGNVISATPADGTADGIKINPQTGDDTPVGLFAAILVAAVLVLAGVLVYRRKRR